MPSIKHIVMFRLHDRATEDDHRMVVDALLSLPSSCGVDMISYECGTDLRLRSGLTHPLGPNRHVSWTCTFATVEEYTAYNTSAAHGDFLALLKPLLEPGSRAAIQYEIP